MKVYEGEVKALDAVRSLMITRDLTNLPIDLAAIIAFGAAMFTAA